VKNVKTRQSRYFAAKAHDKRFVFKYCSTRGYLKQDSVSSRPLRVSEKETERRRERDFKIKVISRIRIGY